METLETQPALINNQFLIEHIVYKDSSSMTINHFHNTYEIYYMLKGERYYFIQDRTYCIMKGDIVLININELHKTTYSGSKNAERILLNFNPSFVEPYIKDASDIDIFECFRSNIHVIRLSINEQGFAENLLLRLIKEKNSSESGHKTLIKIHLMELLIFLNRCAKKTTELDFKHLSPVHQKISEIVVFINNNYSEDISLSIISQKYNISAYHLSRLFKKVTGFTFIEYINIVRIRSSQKLLLETKKNITQISQDMGFESITHFGRTFKKITGMSPLQYRKSNSNTFK